MAEGVIPSSNDNYQFKLLYKTYLYLNYITLTSLFYF